MSLIDGTREGGLERCCANISALRDVLITVAREGGEVNPWTEARLRETLGWVIGSHDIGEIPALREVCRQLHITGAQLRHTPTTGPEEI